MIAAIQHNKSVSIEEFLRIDREENREKNGKYEYFNQKMIYMAGGKLPHGAITINVGAALMYALKHKKSPNSVYTDTKVSSYLDYKNYVYPDAVVSDGKGEYEDEKKDILTNPLLVVEVVSDSTEGFDRGDKFKSYRNIPSFKEYLIVSQDKRSVEQFYKDKRGNWQIGVVVTEGSLKLKSMDIKIALDDIYFNVDLTVNE